MEKKFQLRPCKYLAEAKILSKFLYGIHHVKMVNLAEIKTLSNFKSNRLFK